MDQDLKTLREQLAQLQALHESGALGHKQFEESRAALERRIVAAVMAGSAPAAPGTPTAAAAAPAVPPAVRVPRRLWAAAGAFVLALAVAGYAWKGSPELSGVAPGGFGSGEGGGAAAAGSAPHNTGRAQIETMVERLAARLAKNGEDPDGWSLLGRSEMALGRYPEASAAYAKSLALRPDDAPTLADQADAVAMANGRQLAGEPTKLIERALQLEPDNLKALTLAGSAAFERGDYPGAVRHWDRAISVGPADHPFVQMAREGATEARERGKLPPAAGAPVVAAARPAGPAAAATKPAAAASGAISGTVRLAAALKDRAAPDDRVFIFARAAGGGGMPLAIVQTQVKNLPAVFTLDDSQSMSPAALLSQAPSVVVTARVSKTGQAVPASGDLEGQSRPVTPGARDVIVEIASVRP